MQTIEIDPTAYERVAQIRSFCREIRAHFSRYKPHDLTGLTFILVPSSEAAKQAYLAYKYLPQMTRIPESKWYCAQTNAFRVCASIQTNLGVVYY